MKLQIRYTRGMDQNVWSQKEAPEKIRRKHLKRYGGSARKDTEEAPERIRRKRLERCGGRAWKDTEEVPEKIRRKHLERYGGSI